MFLTFSWCSLNTVLEGSADIEETNDETDSDEEDEEYIAWYRIHDKWTTKCYLI